MAAKNGISVEAVKAAVALAAQKAAAKVKADKAAEVAAAKKLKSDAAAEIKAAKAAEAATLKAKKDAEAKVAIALKGMKGMPTECELSDIAAKFANLENSSGVALFHFCGHLAAIADSLNIKGERKAAYAIIGEHCATAVSRTDKDGNFAPFSVAWVSLQVNAWKGWTSMWDGKGFKGAPETPAECHLFRSIANGNAAKAKRVKEAPEPATDPEPIDDDEAPSGEFDGPSMIEHAINQCLLHGMQPSLIEEVCQSAIKAARASRANVQRAAAA